VLVEGNGRRVAHGHRKTRGDRRKKGVKHSGAGLRNLPKNNLWEKTLEYKDPGVEPQLLSTLARTCAGGGQKSRENAAKGALNACCGWGLGVPSEVNGRGLVLLVAEQRPKRKISGLACGRATELKAPVARKKERTMPSLLKNPLKNQVARRVHV